jgi:predicted PurR-regulated permease PerM
MIPERALTAVLIGGVAAGCVLVLYPFFSALLWAAILVFTTWPLAEWFRVNLRLGHGGAAGLMVALTAVVLMLPLALAAPGGASDVNHLKIVIQDALQGGLPDAPKWVLDIPVVGPSFVALWDRWAADITALGESLQPYFGILLEGGLNLLLGIAHGVLLFALALFVAFFFFLYGDHLSVRLRLLAHRIAGAHAERLIRVTGATVRGVVYGILGTAIVQGVLTAFGLWIADVPRPVLLGALAGFLAVLPIGAPLVWIPASIWLLNSGHVGHGIFLACYGVLAVTGADHVIRPWFIARGAQLPFLLVVLGVLGGALAFGLLGIFLGPVLLAIGLTLINEWLRSADPAPGER